MTPHPYRVICETQTPTTISYLSEWFPTPEAAHAAKAQHQQEGWQSVEMVPPGQVPGASITGRQVLAVGGVRLPRQPRKNRPWHREAQQA